jgi:hypothetical protein
MDNTLGNDICPAVCSCCCCCCCCFPALQTQRNILEDPARGFLANDTIIIKYTIELVVSSGGALSRSSNGPSKAELIRVPPPSIGKDLGELFRSGEAAGGLKYTSAGARSIHAHACAYVCVCVSMNARSIQMMAAWRGG